MEDANEIISSVLEIVSCPVCFNRLPPEIECCIKGHAVCEQCKRNLTTCPICRNIFSEETHTIFSQVLEALPYPCENQGCNVVVKNIKLHEKRCSYRLSRCRICDWSGILKNLFSHIKEAHIIHPWSSSDSDECIIEDFGVGRDEDTTFWFVYCEHVFWMRVCMITKYERLLLQIVCITDEEVKYDDSFVARVEFNSDDHKYTAELKLRENSDTGFLECDMFFNSAMAEEFINENNELSYQLFIRKR